MDRDHQTSVARDLKKIRILNFYFWYDVLTTPLEFTTLKISCGEGGK